MSLTDLGVAERPVLDHVQVGQLHVQAVEAAVAGVAVWEVEFRLALALVAAPPKTVPRRVNTLREREDTVKCNTLQSDVGRVNTLRERTQ